MTVIYVFWQIEKKNDEDIDMDRMGAEEQSIHKYKNMV